MYLERVVRFEINNFVSLREKRTTKRVFFHSHFRNACVQIGFLVKVPSPEKKRGIREKPLVLHAVSVAEKRDYEIAIVVAQFFAYFLIFCSFFFCTILAGATSLCASKHQPDIFHVFLFSCHRVIYLRLEVYLASTHSRMPCQLFFFIAAKSVRANETIERIGISISFYTKRNMYMDIACSFLCAF